MNIVLLASFNNKFPYIKELRSNLIKKGDTVEIIDIGDMKIIEKNGTETPFPLLIKMFRKVPRLGFRLVLFYASFLLYYKRKQIDVINIHPLSFRYNKIFKYTNRHNNKLIITIWGSDMYRSSNLQRKKQRILINKAKFINVATKQMKNDLITIYGINENKIKLARFGIGKFDLIREIQKKKDKADLMKELSIPVNKIVICCGYNGKIGQRHSLMIKAISELPLQYKEKLFLLFQFTYGDSNNYIGSIKNELEQTNLSYLLLDTYLSDYEVSIYRIITDIVINIQITDALSGSLQEHIFSNNILLAGDWLPYNIYDENSICYYKTSLENLNESILYILKNIDLCKNECKNNHELIYKLNSWDTTINDWRRLYSEV